MRQHLHNSFVAPVVTATSLQSLLNNLVNDLLQHSQKNRNIIVNEVTSDITMLADESRILPVLRDLLCTVVNNARNGRIHISAERFRDILTVEIEERNTYNGYALSYSLKALESVARLAGGYLSIKGQHQLKTTVTFSFPNQPGNLYYDC